MSSSNTVGKAMIRLMSDLKQMKEEPPEGVSAEPVDSRNLMNWTGLIIGPENSPFEGGIFQLSLNFNESYPDQPPKIKFVTPIFHPNVYADGAICLDILTNKWSPVYSVSSILTSIQSLLSDENPNSPANPEAANLFIKDKKEYRKRVRQCVDRSINIINVISIAEPCPTN
ncbi:hypothetical protein PPL_06725 [Heterostelium album PN500]|uniref:UBC core domain-containing protein n=1 Tax=Heterostelium pallidum (strain ATCC 26659 / Pp 5 / PN500) TaxID=670386 RepID=D3BFJ1_HETP5|nr:hypothetical protein PPL_06725 [Heterostelium album PN500]EFA79905.1 hypothetical protein PPL_06725 [Heterostelium album PN500]|eukprot:XP_020432026.1 hypothetical protein PPL_06725 [Heterostelium album PN500]